MIRFLENIRAGILEPSALKRAESTKRAYNLGLSLSRDVERIHTAAVNTLDLDPVEEQYLLSGSSDGSIYIHNLYNITGSPNYTAQAVCTVDRSNENAHQYGVECVQWYPSDTGLFITSGMDKQMKVWDSNTMKPVDVFKFDFRVFQHDISTNCLVAVAGTSNQIQLVDLKSGSCTHELRGHSSSILTCKWSAHQEFLLASGGCDNRVMLWDIRSAKSCLLSLDQHNRYSLGNQATAHDGYVNGLSYTSDGLFLLTFGTDNKLKLWSTLTGLKEMVNYGKIPNNLKRCKHIAVTAVSSPTLVYIPSEGNIYVYEVNTGVRVDTLVGHYNFVNSCVYHRHYHELYSAGKDMIILIWTADEPVRDQEPISSKSRDRPIVRTNIMGDTWSSDDD